MQVNPQYYTGIVGESIRPLHSGLLVAKHVAIGPFICEVWRGSCHFLIFFFIHLWSTDVELPCSQ